MSRRAARGGVLRLVALGGLIGVPVLAAGGRASGDPPEPGPKGEAVGDSVETEGARAEDFPPAEADARDPSRQRATGTLPVDPPREPAPGDSLPPGAAADTLESSLPSGFGPRDASAGPFLRPTPSVRGAAIPHLGAFDAFLLPPEGPARFFDRSDLRLTGHTEWWDISYLVPGLFTLRPGYPGTVTPFSFRARGPDGTMILYDGRALGGGYAPIEHPTVIGRGHLAGAAVMRAGASHIYGPGAGAGAIQLLPVARTPEGAITEATTMTGVFGQRSGSITTALHWSRVGIVFEYDGAGARPFTLFDGYRAERAHGRLDWLSGGTTIAVSARRQDEKLRHFDELEKRSDDGWEIVAGAEHRTEMWVGAVRGVRQVTTVRGDGPAGFAWQELERWSGEALVDRFVTDGLRIGLLGGVHRDRRERRDVFDRLAVRHGTIGYALSRLRASAWGVHVDTSVRWDRLVTDEDVVAAGATLSRHIGAEGIAWVHAARTVDRPAYFHRTTDVATQVHQGFDLPLPRGTRLPSGWNGAAGLALREGRLATELGASVDRTERTWAQLPAPQDGPLALDEPSSSRTQKVDQAGGWASVELGPIWLGRVLGSFALGASGFASSTPEIRRLQVEPFRHGEVWGRLRKDLFDGSMRVEGELGWEVLDEMLTLFGDVPPQSQVTARMSVQIGDAIVVYRSENILDQRFLSSAYDESVGYAPITTRNVTVGASWVLVD